MQSQLPKHRREAHGVFSVRLYDESRCGSIVTQALHVDEWQPARVGGDGRPSVDAALRAAWHANPSRLKAIHNDFEKRVLQVVRPVLRQVWGCDFERCEGTHLVRYRRGGHFVPHKDADEDHYAFRYFTVLCYLNNNFKGGKTSFESLGYCATPIPGKALIFPSRFVHCGESVLSGEKFVLVTWLCGPAPVHWM